MMIKYRVREVAKDLNIPNKDVLDTLAKYFPEPKKYMTALTEEELDVVFEAFTQQRNMESLDAYFAQREAAAPAQEAAPAPKAPQKAPASKGEASQKAPEGRRQEKGQAPAPQQAAPQAQKPAAPAPEAHKQPVRRVVDTRSSNVNIDKYNEKYDQLADQKVKTRTDNVVTKQKFPNRNSQRRGQRRGKRETEAERLNRIARERAAKHITIEVPDEITVGEFALRLKVSAPEVIKKLMSLGVFAAINDTIDFDTAVLVADEFHAKVEKEVVVTIEERIIDDSEDDEANLVPRAPVVVVMGHVDHGKTSILDVIRHSHVTEGEAGGITQHIGAYRVQVDGRDITFLDTPGHAAFTAMRARGAQVTDVIVLVVAADDGIMPQTIEAINHAKAAEVPIVVAVNKIDKPGANPDRVRQELVEYGVIPEEWGGTNMFVEVSAKQRLHIDDVLETIILQADVLELKANPDAEASGFVIEANLDKGRGPVATVLVQRGTLHPGDVVVAGTSYGRVRALVDPHGKHVDSAGPADPVEILGLNSVPTAGDEFRVFEDERDARKLAEERALRARLAEQESKSHMSLDDLFNRIEEGKQTDLNLIVKADVQGSIEALRDAFEKMDQSEVRINIVHSAVGGITETDVTLASASDAIIIGFNVRPTGKSKQQAEKEKVDIRLYRIIYQAIEEINAARVGLLSPDIVEEDTGIAEVRETFKVPKVGTIAGCYIVEGEIHRDDKVRIVRDGTIIFEGVMESLRRFKDDVKSVKQGYECGIGIEKFQDLKIGDHIEGYTVKEVERTE